MSNTKEIETWKDKILTWFDNLSVDYNKTETEKQLNDLNFFYDDTETNQRLTIVYLAAMSVFGTAADKLVKNNIYSSCLIDFDLPFKDDELHIFIDLKISDKEPRVRFECHIEHDAETEQNLQSIKDQLKSITYDKIFKMEYNKREHYEDEYDDSIIPTSLSLSDAGRYFFMNAIQLVDNRDPYNDSYIELD